MTYRRKLCRHTIDMLSTLVYCSEEDANRISKDVPSTYCNIVPALSTHTQCQATFSHVESVCICFSKALLIGTQILPSSSQLCRLSLQIWKTTFAQMVSKRTGSTYTPLRPKFFVWWSPSPWLSLFSFVWVPEACLSMF